MVGPAGGHRASWASGEGGSLAPIAVPEKRKIRPPSDFCSTVPSLAGAFEIEADRPSTSGRCAIHVGSRCSILGPNTALMRNSTRLVNFTCVRADGARRRA